MVQKKLTAILLLLIMLAGCQKTEQTETTAPIVETTACIEETEETPTKPTFVQPWISQEQAMLSGFVVVQDGDVRENQNRWQAYMEATEKKEPVSITVMHYRRTEVGFAQTRYDLAYDGSLYHLTIMENGEKKGKSYAQLLKQQEPLDESWEPYDSVIRYVLRDSDKSMILFEDLIAETDLNGVTEIYFHLKESEPALKRITDADQVKNILSLLNHAEYLPGDPQNYYYGVKLITTNGKGEQLVLELDLNKGNYRYGMQTYCYGDVSDMLSLLEFERWPDEVYEEHGIYIE